MKRLGVVGLAVIFLGVYSLASAAPVGNPSKFLLEEGNEPFKVGVELDFVDERELDVPGSNVEVSDYGWYMLKGSYLLEEEKMELYLLLGMAKGDITTKDPSFTLAYELDAGFAWGLGASAIVYEFDNGIMVGVDTKYRQSESDINKLVLDGVSYSPGAAGITNFTASYSEWQASVGISKQYDQFIPYGGVKYSDAEVTVKATIAGTPYVSDSINSDNVFGIFIGCDYAVSDNISLGLEGRFIDETAFSVSGTYRF